LAIRYLTEPFNENTPHIGEIPLEEYLYYLTERRYFNKELVLSHTKEVYEIELDIEQIEKCSGFWGVRERNIFNSFNEINPIKHEDDGTRDYFNTVGKSRYKKFANSHFDTAFGQDALCPFMITGDIHHIYPLLFSFNNSIENLLHLSKINHGLLHMNPIQISEKACKMSVDYLGYLYTFRGLRQIVKENEVLNDRSDMDLFRGFLKAIINNKMRKFYERLVIKFEMEETLIGC
jgi:hypothetical protein